MGMADIKDLEMTWISLKELQKKRSCKHCKELLEVKQMNLTEACYMCFNNECPNLFLELPDIEYIHRSYRYMDDTFNSNPEAAAEVVSLEEEMQSINNLFSEIEGMLSPSVYEKYKRELSKVCGGNPVSDSSAVSHRSVYPQQDWESPSLNRAGKISNFKDSSLPRLQQQLNITDLTNTMLNGPSINNEQCSESSEKVDSQSFSLLQNKTKPPSAINNVNVNSEDSNANEVSVITESLNHSSCSETLLSTFSLKNEEILSSTYCQGNFGPADIIQENLNEITDINSSGSLENWLESIVGLSEEPLLPRHDIAVEPPKGNLETTPSVDEKLLAHITEEYQEKEQGHCMAANNFHNVEEDHKSSIEETFFSRGERKTYRCYRSKRKHQQQTCQNKVESTYVDVVTDLTQKNASDLVTLTSPPANFYLFNSFSDKNSPSTSVMPDESDQKDFFKVGCTEGDPYELFGDVALDTHKYCDTVPPDVLLDMQPSPQEEKKVKEEPEQSVERSDEDFYDLKEEIVEENQEEIEVLMESCCTIKKQDEAHPVLNGGSTSTVKDMESPGEDCGIVETPEVLLASPSLEPSSGTQSRGKVVQRRRKYRRKTLSAKTRRKTKTPVLSDAMMSMNTDTDANLNSTSVLGFTELSSFGGAKCSLPVKKETCRPPRKPQKMTGEDIKLLSNPSDEIEKAIASERMLSTADGPDLEELIRILS